MGLVHRGNRQKWVERSVPSRTHLRPWSVEGLGCFEGHHQNGVYLSCHSEV